MAKIAINGFGRIGRAFFKLALTKPELEIVAINDLGDLENLAYLLRYDSVYGRYNEEVKTKEVGGKKYLLAAGKEVLFLQEKEPTKLPWKDLNVDVVVEATGVFESYEKASVHLQAGAKKVVLTAPAKDEDGGSNKTVLMGVNEGDAATCTITSNGSCTTNSASSVMQILSEKIGVKKAFLNTVHGYTATQSLIDGPVKGHDMRRGRAAGVNIVPTATGAAIAVARALPNLKDKFDGMAMRVPTATGSLSAIVFLAEKSVTVEEINTVLKEAEQDPRWKGIFKTTSEPIVSSDIIGNPYAAIVDLELTKVVDGDLCCVYSWYDNEFGYTNTLVEHVLKVSKN
ncbi:MAG: type I glyceraldehyde-3-phosphate dehydrogenase [Candidatus Yanofskybacteria bacterium]|nr:type I glyceraldehyde-3-phosphate dehydrogenase [Candidatus Yanofskybacteria bacterium]